MEHPWFANIDWQAIYNMDTKVPFVPRTEGTKYLDHFDKEFTREDPINSMCENGSTLLKEFDEIFDQFSFTYNKEAMTQVDRNELRMSEF